VLRSDEAFAALRAAPGGAWALGVLAEHPGAWVVGGAVRDALLADRRPFAAAEIDVVVEGDPEPVARALGEVVAWHERFNTYDVITPDGGHVDVVMARAERYSGPGALPEVRPGDLEDDLLRRDFTVNAVALNGVGELAAAPAALEDLEAGRLRVMHAGSFRDDPTRLWRLVRYAVRLGFTPEPATDRLAFEAIQRGALETVSGDRLGAELRLALGERAPLSVLHAAQNLGLVRGLDLDPRVVGDALALLPVGEGRADLLLLGAVLPDVAWVDGWGFTAAEARVLTRCACARPLDPGARPSEVVARLRGEPVEAVAVAGARGDAEQALRYLGDWRHVRLRIDGNDLLGAGVPQGPELGRRLDAVLARRLDGELPDDRDAQLAAALDC
jgi:tRNA nucleotidyltransferase (CCA-adding enzyme)